MDLVFLTINRSLLFVYNADSGIVNALKDYGKKMVDKNFYKCNLCGVIFGPLGMKRKWKQYIDSLDRSVEFMHKDEFKEIYSHNTSLPAVFLRNNDSFDLFISKKEIDACDTIEDLISLINSHLTLLRP